QSLDASLCGGELSVIEIIGMNGNAVQQRGETRRSFHRRTNHGGFAIAAALLDVLARDRSAFGARTSHGQAEAIEDGFFAELDDFRGNIFVFGLQDKLSDVPRKSWSLWKVADRNGVRGFGSRCIGRGS